MNKFRNERFITQRQGTTGLWSFQVFIRYEEGTITKTFSEKEFGSPRLAYETAVSFKEKKLEEIRNKVVFKKCDLTVNDMFEQYLDNTTDSFATKKRKRSIYNRLFSCKDKKIQEITKADIQNNLNSIVEKVTDDTIMRVFSIWKNDIIGTALMNEYITKDVMLGVKKPKSKVIHIKKKTDTNRETIDTVEELLLNSSVNSYNSRMIVYLIEVLYYTGMRPAEAIALNRDDIHEDYISITKELGSSIEENNVIRRCKTPTSIREIPISPSLRPIIEELLEFSNTYEIFKREDGRYMDSSWVGNIISYILKKSGKNVKFNMYRLRHNMATELISNNVDSRTTMDILGHSSFNMSLYYANSTEKQKKEAIQLLS